MHLFTLPSYVVLILFTAHSLLISFLDSISSCSRCLILSWSLFKCLVYTWHATQQDAFVCWTGWSQCLHSLHGCNSYSYFKSYHSYIWDTLPKDYSSSYAYTHIHTSTYTCTVIPWKASTPESKIYVLPSQSVMKVGVYIVPITKQLCKFS
jgi:hypothetical protein